MHLTSLLLPLVLIYTVNGKTGEEIADALYQNPNTCKDPSDGGIWAPLQGENPDCGGKKCNFPQQWCSATSDPAASENKPKLNCVDLPPDCQKALAGGSETTTAAPTDTTAAAETTTTERTTTSPTTTRPTTQATSRASSPSSAPAGATTAAPGGAGSAGCKDNHEFCCFWAARQQCDANAGWMRTQCPSSCGTCGCQASNFQTCQVKVNTTGCKYLPGGGGQGNRVRIPLSGGNRLAAFGFGNNGQQGGNGTQSSIVKIPVGGGLSPVVGMPGFGPQSTGTGAQSSKVTIPIGGGPSPFGQVGSNNGTGTGFGGQQPRSNMVRIPLGGGPGPFGPVGGMPGGVPPGAVSGAGAPGAGGQPSSVVTIPIGRKRRHFMPRWFNNA